MVWKFIIVIFLLVGSTNAGFNCEKATTELDDCREKGYIIGDCKVGDGTLSKKQIRKCDKMVTKFDKKCDEYQCEKGN